MIVSSAIVIGALVIVAVSGLVVEHLRVGLLTQTIQPALLVNRQVVRAMTDARNAVNDYASNPSQTSLADYHRAVPEIMDGLAEVGPLAAKVGLAGTAEHQRIAAQRWLDEVAAPSLSDPPRPPVASAADADFADFRQANIDLNSELVGRNSDLAQETLWVSALVVGAVMVSGVSGLAVILARGRRAQAAITPPLEELHRVVMARAAGDFNVRADPTAGVVEVRAVAQAVNELMAVAAREQQRMAEDADLAGATRRVGMSISHTLDMSEIMNTTAAQLRKELRADVAWVRTFEGENDRPGRVLGTLQPSTVTLVSPPELQQIGIDMAPKLWAQQRAAHMTAKDPGVPEIVAPADGLALVEFVRDGADVNNLLLVGLGAGSQCLGYFALGRCDIDSPWTDAEARAAIDIGHYIGRAVLHERMFDGERLLVEQLQALDFQKDEFVSTVSHELRTPLSAIIGHLELIDDEDVSGPARRSLQTVDRNAQRLRMLIEDLLLLSRVENREAAPARQVVDLDAITAQAVADQDGVVAGVRTQYSGSLGVDVLGDADELARVVFNLVGNAAKFSAPGSTVLVRVQRSGGSAVLRVIDRGIGIAEADQPHVFTRFFRSRRLEANSVPGTGLGLAITKLIVEKHDGTIDLESELGHGTTVTVTLPLAGARAGSRRGGRVQAAG